MDVLVGVSVLLILLAAPLGPAKINHQLMCSFKVNAKFQYESFVLYQHICMKDGHITQPPVWC